MLVRLSSEEVALLLKEITQVADGRCEVGGVREQLFLTVDRFEIVFFSLVESSLPLVQNGKI